MNFTFRLSISMLYLSNINPNLRACIISQRSRMYLWLEGVESRSSGTILFFKWIHQTAMSCKNCDDLLRHIIHPFALIFASACVKLAIDTAGADEN